MYSTGHVHPSQNECIPSCPLSPREITGDPLFLCLWDAQGATGTGGKKGGQVAAEEAMDWGQAAADKDWVP